MRRMEMAVKIIFMIVMLYGYENDVRTSMLLLLVLMLLIQLMVMMIMKKMCLMIMLSL